MFSPLARGKGDWDGGLQFEEFSDQPSPVEPLLPQLLVRASPGNKSARSTNSSFVLRDGRIALPKTFVTRKGAIVLFTPSDELLNHGNEESHLNKEDVYEAGLKLRTLGNLTNSVLEFGKEDEEAWEESNGNDVNQQKTGDKSTFLRFLHYLDLENLTSDKHVQPGADPDYYLEELRKSSGHGSQRRFRSQTPFSTRTSHSTNTYSHFLEDDEEITSIIQEHMKYGRSEWVQTRGPVSHGVVSSDHMPDIGVEGREASDDFSCLSSPRANRSYTASMPTAGYRSSVTYEGMGDSMSRPKTAPIPPTVGSPKANPRITSARPPPMPRALGSTPNHLDEILSADVGFGRYHRRGPSPRLRLSRSSSPSLHPGSSRGATPRLVSPDGKSEDWNRTANVIEEEDEASIPPDQVGAGKVRRPSSAGGSLQSGTDERVNIQRRVSSAGATSRKSRPSVHSSRSGSASSVSHHYIRSLSAVSHHPDYTALSEEFDYPDREDASPVWPGVREELVTTRHQSAGDAEGEATWQPLNDAADSRVSSPFLDSVSRSPPHPPRSPSVASRIASPSSRIASPETRSPSVLSLRENTVRSRGSSASSSDEGEQWTEAAEKATARYVESSASARDENIASVQNDREEEVRDEKETRTRSAATQGSEADLAQVSEVVARSQSVAEGVYEDVLNELETADQVWPGVVSQEDEEDLSPPSEGDDEDSITREFSTAPLEKFSRPSSPPTVPVVQVEESSDTASTRPDPPLTVEENERPPLHDEEAVTSLPTTPDVHEREAVISPEIHQEKDVTSQPMSPVKLVSAPTLAQSSTTTADIQSFSPIPGPAKLQLDVQESQDNSRITPEGSKQKALDVPRASSPAPIKADAILHTELLPSTGLEIEGKVRGRQSPSPYKETIDIEKSRPQSPVSGEQRNVPVSVGEAVLKYIETGQEPQVRERSSRSRRGSETGTEEKGSASKPEVELASTSASGSIQKSGSESRTKAEMTKPTEPARLNLSTKPKASPVGKSKAEPKPDLPVLNLLKSDDSTKAAKPSDEEREARRQMVSGLLSKPDAPKGGKLELEGIGKEGEESESAAGGLVTRVSPPMNEKKNDLSDLAALVAKNKPPSKPKEKKVDSKKKLGKSSKSTKKKDEPSIDPENIDFDAFNTPEMLDEMDDELRQFILEQSGSDVNPAAVNQSSDVTVVKEGVQRKESVQTLEVPQFAPEVSPDKREAYSPSKPKKMSKKELTKMRADQRKEERKKKEEEKRMQEEEVRLLKEREEEAARAKAEAEEKQKSIEEEMSRRLAEEEDAKREEEEALERLKDAKKKAREEREARRAAEAERRKLEVQKKREEKKKRDEESKEKEKELEQQKVDREKRKTEIEEARRRREEMERLEDEKIREEERLLALQEEEEQRRLEEEQIREAEAELERLQEEREYREQMRKIAEMQEAKLRAEEEERLRKEEEERKKIEEENRKREEAEQEREREEQKRIEMSRRLEALARMRTAQAAARRKALLLKRREDNVERIQNLKFTRAGQHITRAYIFTYFTHIPRRVWEVPIGFNKKKKGARPVRKKPPEPKPE